MTVHIANEFFVPRGFEYPMTLLVANLALMLLGSDPATADAMLPGLMSS